MPVRHGREEVFQPAAPVPVALLVLRRLDVDHPVHELTAVGIDIVADRIDQQLGRMMPADADHAGAGHERLPAGDAAPHVDAGIFRRALVRIELLAQHRMDALAGHRHGAAHGGERLAVRILESGDRLVAVVVDARAAVTEDDLVGAGARLERLEQHHLQVAAMDGELRHVVAGEAAGRLAVDVLAEAVVEAVFARGHRHLGERLFQAESAQFARGMRQHVDADADLPDLGRRLEDAAGDAGAVQHQAEREAADAGADDQDFHGDFIPRIFYAACRRLTSSNYRKSGTAPTRRARLTRRAARRRPWRPRAPPAPGPATPARPSRQATGRGSARRPGRSAPG